MDITERFLNYTKFDTQSAEDSQTVPSTSKQLIFAEYLKKELEHEGLDDVEMDDKGHKPRLLGSGHQTANREELRRKRHRAERRHCQQP